MSVRVTFKPGLYLLLTTQIHIRISKMTAAHILRSFAALLQKFILHVHMVQYQRK